MKITHKKLISAAETIECGALSNIADHIKKLSKTLWGALLKLAGDGISVDKSEAGKNGVFYLQARTKGGNKFAVRCTPRPNSKNFDLAFLTEKGSDSQGVMDVPESELSETIALWAYEHFDEDSPELSSLIDEDTGESKLDAEDAATEE